MPLRRALTVVAAATTALLVAAPAPAGTSQTIGQTSGTPIGCPANLTAVQATDATGATYTVPSAGVLTSFSFLADSDPGQVRALVFTRTASNTFQLVGKSALVATTPDALNTFPTRIPVPAGALLGGQVSSNLMRCAVAASSSGDEFRTGVYDPDSSATFTTTGSHTGRWNISAVLESDADSDGYGDVTQDLCPESAATQSACAGAAPDTTVTKAPKKKSTKRKAKIVFTSTVAGSTFTCQVDKKAAKPCSSPFKKKFKYGKHKVLVTAVSPFGIADPTPVTVRFKVLEPT